MACACLVFLVCGARQRLPQGRRRNRLRSADVLPAPRRRRGGRPEDRPDDGPVACPEHLLE